MQDLSSDVNIAVASWPVIWTVCLRPALQYTELNYQAQSITTSETGTLQETIINNSSVAPVKVRWTKGLVNTKDLISKGILLLDITSSKINSWHMEHPQHADHYICKCFPIYFNGSSNSVWAKDFSDFQVSWKRWRNLRPRILDRGWHL